MKRADLKTLELTLARLPVDLKKYFSNQLLGQINAQADTLIETARSHPPCPHCGNKHPVKWGRAGGLPRYRCRNLACLKTFNGLTGTPLAKLHHRDKWFDYLRCMRESARANVNALSGIIEVDETFFAESCKGKRHLTHRKPRKRGGRTIGRKKRIRFQSLSCVIAMTTSVTWWIRCSIRLPFTTFWRRSSITIRFYVRTGTAGIRPSLLSMGLLITD